MCGCVCVEDGGRKMEGQMPEFKKKMQLKGGGGGRSGEKECRGIKQKHDGAGNG